MAYTKTTWVDDSDPYLNATNLNKIEQGIEDATDTADGAVQKSGDTMTGALIVPAPSAATHVPRLARTPNPTTGDLGLPGYAGSDTGWRDVSSLLVNGWTKSTTSGFARLRRAGTNVYASMRLNAAAATSLNVLTLPVGFRPDADGVFGGICSYPANLIADTGFATGATPLRVMTSTFGTPTVTIIVVSWVFPADAPWPTSLPGTQITAPASWT